MSIEKKEKEKSNKILNKNDQKKFKALISVLEIISHIGEILILIGIGFLATLMIAVPVIIKNVKVEDLAKAIYPVGFYENKAKQIIELSRQIVDELDGKVPDEIEELCKFKGVGRKTANLVLARGFNKPAICVDVHVHRIFNRLGYVKTKNPEETEFALR